jgi:hypothetical protein
LDDDSTGWSVINANVFYYYLLPSYSLLPNTLSYFVTPPAGRDFDCTIPEMSHYLLLLSTALSVGKESPRPIIIAW